MKDVKLQLVVTYGKNLCSYNIGFRESYHSMFHDDVVIREVVACRLQCPKLFLLPVRVPDKLKP